MNCWHFHYAGRKYAVVTGRPVPLMIFAFQAACSRVATFLLSARAARSAMSELSAGPLFKPMLRGQAAATAGELSELVRAVDALSLTELKRLAHEAGLVPAPPGFLLRLNPLPGEHAERWTRLFQLLDEIAQGKEVFHALPVVRTSVN